MPLEFITHNGRKYLNHESIGGASLWIRPLAQYYCIGRGLDIGYSKEVWMLPNAVGIEPSIDAQWDALRLPKNPDNLSGLWDFIHSSHCLEHVKENIYIVLDYWLSKLMPNGILFLYLPHSSQSYWHPSSNRKHVHKLDESEIETYLNDLGHKVYVSGVDWNHSFVVICEKFDVSGDALRRCADAILKLEANEKLNIEPIKKQLQDEYREHQVKDYVKTNQPFISPADIPTGHYAVKDSLLYNFPKKEIIKPLSEYNAGDRVSQSEYLLLIERPFYNDRMLLEDDTKPEEIERHYIIKAIKR